MKKATSAVVILLIGFLLSVPSTQGGIAKVAKRWNMIDFYAGGSMITGEYEGLGSDDWDDIFFSPYSADVDGNDLYNTTFHLGFDYGQLRNNHMFFSIGFRYTKVEIEDSVVVDFPDAIGIVYFRENDFNINLFDLDFNLNYYPLNVNRHYLLPYLGVGFKGGFMVFDNEGRDPETGYEYESESEIKFTLSLNFGADLKIWSSPSGRSFVTLSSINSWDIVASDNRPKYLNIGGGIKYYFRP